MQTITDIQFNKNIYSHVDDWILILYQMEGLSLAISLPSVHLLTFMQPFDNISHCQNYIRTNHHKTFTLFAYSGNIETWLKNNNIIPNNLDQIIMFCPHAEDKKYLKNWTKRYTEKIKNIVTWNVLEREILIFGMKYLEDLFTYFKEDEGILSLFKEDYEQIRLALIKCFDRAANEPDQPIRPGVTATS